MKNQHMLSATMLLRKAGKDDGQLEMEKVENEEKADQQRHREQAQAGRENREPHATTAVIHDMQLGTNIVPIRRLAGIESIEKNPRLVDDTT